MSSKKRDPSPSLRVRFWLTAAPVCKIEGEDHLEWQPYHLALISLQRHPWSNLALSEIQTWAEQVASLTKSHRPWHLVVPGWETAYGLGTCIAGLSCLPSYASFPQLLRANLGVLEFSPLIVKTPHWPVKLWHSHFPFHQFE